MSPSTLTRLLLSAASLAGLVSPAPVLAAETTVWRAHADPVLGTSFDMAVHGSSEAEAQFAFAAARAEIARLDSVLSAWRPTGELAALNRTDNHQASPDLYAVMAACEAWRARTGGAFNANLGKAEALWSQADTAPDEGALCDAAQAAQPLRLDAATRTIFRPEGVQVAPDGLAKGYILDQALAAARRASPCAAGMLIDIGGDMVCFGTGSAGQAWSVGIAHPTRQADNAPPALAVRVTNKALAVSGPGQRDRLMDGIARSHLLDPATGQPAPRQQTAVIADRAVDADAAATALAVLPPDRALALAESLPGIEAAIFPAGSGPVLTTSGWKAYDASGLCQAAAPLPAGYGVEVTYEAPKIDVANSKHPFVVIWVTDADKALVKTLMVSATKKNWIDNVYVWWRRYGRQDPAQFDANLKPTRPPGKYTVEWDGADAAGKRVPQGQYVIHIEAAREHGGHAYQEIPVALGAKPLSAGEPGKDELGAAQVKYLKH
jgi:thiamine biosynthesis lipoprotein